MPDSLVLFVWNCGNNSWDDWELVFLNFKILLPVVMFHTKFTYTCIMMNVFCLLYLHIKNYITNHRKEKKINKDQRHLYWFFNGHPYIYFPRGWTYMYIYTCMYMYMYMFVSFMQVCIVYVVKIVVSFRGARSMDMVRKRTCTWATDQQDDSGRM